MSNHLPTIINSGGDKANADSNEDHHLLHHLMWFADVWKTSGVHQYGTLDQLYDQYVKLSANAINVAPTQEAIREAKKIAPAVIHAEMDGRGRAQCNFIGSTLITIDVDQKNFPERYSLHDFVDIIRNLNLDAIVYSTISHKNGNTCLRIILNVGISLNYEQYKQCVEWFQSKLQYGDVVDPASYNCVQLMFLPNIYSYTRPIVKRIDGRPIYPQYMDQICLGSTSTTASPAMSKQTKVPGLSANSIDEDFLRHIELLHPKIQPHKLAGSSVQFHRDLYDHGPGLFCTERMRVILDGSRNCRHQLLYSHAEFQVAKTHYLPPYDELKSALLSWESSENGYAVLKTNAGYGKSRILQDLATSKPSGRRRVFSFHTIEKRDEFISNIRHSNEFLVVKSNREILGDVIDDPDRRKAALSELDEQYRLNMTSTYTGAAVANGDSSMAKTIVREIANYEFEQTNFEHMISNINCINTDERRAILKEAKVHNERLRSPKNLIMTTRKLEFVASYSSCISSSNSIVYTDEVSLGMLTYIPDNAERLVYGSRVAYGVQDAIRYDELHKLKRCLITVEQGIENELRNNGIEFDSISEPHPTFDPNLEILIVPSTSNKKNARSDIYRSVVAAMPNATIIVDGMKPYGCQYNSVNTKGINSLNTEPVVFISTFPDAREVAIAMHAMGCDEETAKVMLMSNKANQAIGRNQGYRNRGLDGAPSTGQNKCLLLVPKNANLSLHYVTPNCLRFSALEGNSPDSYRLYGKAAKFHFCAVIDRMLGKDDMKVSIKQWILQHVSWAEKGRTAGIKQMLSQLGLDAAKTVKIACKIIRLLGFEVKQRGKDREMCIVT